MRVLVTGGAGFIGSHTLVEMLGQAHDALVIDNFDNSSPAVIDRVHSLTNGKVELVTADIRDDQTLLKTMQDFRPDAVIHFAGLKAVKESMERPVDYYDVNVRGTIGLLRTMDAVGCKKIIFSSSATVYGEPVYLPFDEAHPVGPTNVYGRSKLISEQIITDWAQNTGGQGIILRYFNPVGAHPSAKLGEHPDGMPNNLMPFIAQVAVGTRDKLSIFGDDYDTPDGTGERDYIHVVDLARAHVAALDYNAVSGTAEIFNIGTGKPYSVKEMVTAFEKASGKMIPYVVVPRRTGDVASMRADASKARDKLGWTASLGIEDMAKSTWEWQSANPNGYDD